MADVEITHGETGAVVVVPEDALPHYRQSGWITVAEQQEMAEHQAGLAAQAERAAREQSRAAGPRKAGGD